MPSRILSLDNKKEWKSSLEKLPVEQQDIYFTPEYYELYEKNKDGKALCFILEEGNDIALYPFLLNSVNQLGFKDLDREYFDIQGAYGYNGVVSSSYDINFIKGFYKEFKKYCQTTNIIAEFIRFHPLLRNQRFSEGFVNVIQNRRTVYLDLTREYRWIWENEYSSNNRNMIRKATNKNLEILISEDKNDYAEFYRLYMSTMDELNAQKSYRYDLTYFNNLRKFLPLNQNIIKIKLQGTDICIILIMIHSHYAHYHLSARHKDFKHFAANNLALDAAIKFAIKSNCKIFHFGGGFSSSEEDPLLKFKSRFSTTQADFHIGKKIHNEKIYKKTIQQWETKFPKKNEIYSNMLLKYRM